MGSDIGCELCDHNTSSGRQVHARSASHDQVLHVKLSKGTLDYLVDTTFNHFFPSDISNVSNDRNIKRKEVRKRILSIK